MGVAVHTDTGKGPGSMKARNVVSAGVSAALASRPNLDHVIDTWVP